MSNTFDTVIIGAGPAGLSTAIYNATEARSTLVLEKASIGGQARQSARIDNYLGFPHGLSGRHLADYAHRQAREYGASFDVCGAVALGSDGDTRLVQTSDGRIIPCRTVVLATGLQYRRLDIPGADAFGVFYGSNPDDAARWAGKEIVIVGGANSAGQAVVNFARYASRVYVLTRSPLDKSMSAYLIDRVAGLSNVEIIQSAPTAIVPVPGPGLHVFAGDATSPLNPVRASACFLFIGAEPHTEWIPVDKDGHGFITAGVHAIRTHETSIGGVFVAGDVRSGSTKRVAASVGDGALVAAQIYHYMAEKGMAS